MACTLPIRARELIRSVCTRYSNSTICSCVFYFPSHVFAIDFPAVSISNQVIPWFPQKKEEQQKCWAAVALVGSSM